MSNIGKLEKKKKKKKDGLRLSHNENAVYINISWQTKFLKSVVFPSHINLYS